jgi:DNA-binding LytR/AlgR family response regulator
MTRALIADDEPLLRERLRGLLASLWPELEVVDMARNGEEALSLFEAYRPDIVFLDIHMPGMTGLQVAQSIARRAHVVFVTAYDQYAIKAFDEGAIDYVLKPFDEQRLADTVQRLKSRLQGADAGAAADALAPLLQQLAQHMPAPYAYLQWIKASAGQSVKLIPVQQIYYFQSDEKYTSVVWEGGEDLIRTTIRELTRDLDPNHFAQIHRSTIVNLHRVSKVVRGLRDSADLHLHGRNEVLIVSRSFTHLFKQM